MTKNEKISKTLKERFAKQEHHNAGVPGWKHSDEQKEIKRKKSLEHWDKVGRLTDKQKRAKNVANVLAYRARMNNAISETTDLSLIRKIYENCPEGYHVDHIVALAVGGLHHQDNLQYLPVSENCRKGKNRNYDKSLAIDWKVYTVL
jgi:ribosomal protein L39E